MKINSNSEWNEMLAESPIINAKIILTLQYLLYFLYSRTFLFIFFFCICFGISYYFVSFQKVPPLKMYNFAVIVHFIAFYCSDKLINNDLVRNEINQEINEIKNIIKIKRHEIKIKQKENILQ